MTTRADLYALTSGKRAELGPVELFNPEGIGGLELTFRADRALSATVLDEPARRRGGVELAGVWDTLRRGIDDIPAPLPVTVSVRREIVGKFLRIHEADLAEPSGAGSLPEAGSDPGRVIVNLRFRSVGAAEALLAFGSDAEVLAPAELRQALARKAAEAATLYA